MAFEKTRGIDPTPPMVSNLPTDNKPGDTSDAMQAKAKNPAERAMIQQVALARALRDRNNARRGTVARPQIPKDS